MTFVHRGRRASRLRGRREFGQQPELSLNELSLGACTLPQFAEYRGRHFDPAPRSNGQRERLRRRIVVSKAVLTKIVGSQNRSQLLGGDRQAGSQQDGLQSAEARVCRREPVFKPLAPRPRLQFHPRRFAYCAGIRIASFVRHLLEDARFRRPPIVQLERPVSGGSFDVMTQLAVNGLVIDPAKIQPGQSAPPCCALG